MNANVKSNIWLCAQAIPQMAERGNGAVVIVSSIGGLRGSTVIAPTGFPRRRISRCAAALAGEWGPKGVRVNCVAPGLVKTDFARALWEDKERLERRCATTPLRRIGEPDEIAGAVGLSRLGCVELHDRPDHRGRRRRDHGADIVFPSPASAGAGAHVAASLFLLPLWRRWRTLNPSPVRDASHRVHPLPQGERGRRHRLASRRPCFRTDDDGY